MDFSETIVMAEVTRRFCLHQNFVPWGAVCPLPRGYIHVLNHEKLYKIRFQRDFLSQGVVKFCPKGLSAPAPVLYTCIKS